MARGHLEPASTPVGNYTIAVDVRTSTAVYRDAVAYLPYQIVSAVSPATGVTLTPSPAGPQSPGTPVTWTAAASGGSGTYEYQFLVYSGGTWSLGRAYSATPTWNWDTSGLTNGTYVIAVWARNVGATVDQVVAYSTFVLN